MALISVLRWTLKTIFALLAVLVLSVTSFAQDISQKPPAESDSAPKPESFDSAKTKYRFWLVIDSVDESGSRHVEIVANGIELMSRLKFGEDDDDATDNLGVEHKILALLFEGLVFEAGHTVNFKRVEIQTENTVKFEVFDQHLDKYLARY